MYSPDNNWQYMRHPPHRMRFQRLLLYSRSCIMRSQTMQITHNSQFTIHNFQWCSSSNTKIPKYQNTKVLAMTLIEVLIAIFVFAIGILSIITLMTRNISTTQRVHTQNTALILAREWMEMLYNYRDTSSILGYERNCGHITIEGRGDDQTANCDAYIGSGETKYRTIDNREWKKIILSWLSAQSDDFTTLRNASRLSIQHHTADNIQYESYGHQTDGIGTAFARYLVFSWLSDIPDGSAIKSNDILTVQSIVLYDLGWYTGQASLSSFIASRE